MPYYDYFCKTCMEEVEHFFKIADKKEIECDECGNLLEEIFVKAPGMKKVSKPNVIQRKGASVSEIKKDKEFHEAYVTSSRKKNLEVDGGIIYNKWAQSKIHK